MMKPINPGNHPGRQLEQCNEKSPLVTSLNADPPEQFCSTGEPSLRDTDNIDLAFLTDYSNKKTGFGFSKNCDPMQAGLLYNDLNDPNRSVIYRHPKAIRGCDEAMLDLFSNLAVKDDNGKLHRVPIIYATQERAVGAILQDNVRKDGSQVVDALKLPMLSIYQSDIQMDQSKYIYHEAINWLWDNTGKPGFAVKEKYERDTVFGVAKGIPVNIGYTLFLWTMFMEDYDQIITQILTKFSPVAYISVRGVQWETIVLLESIANNLEVEPGEKQRVIKYQFNLKVQTYIPQPIRRNKAVLKTKIDTFNSTEPKEITELLGRLEEAVKELE